MTIGLARRFGDRILIISDTMISEPTGKHEMIPGRVKAAVLAEDISVAYAGAVQHALPALRQAAQIARRGGVIEEIIAPLRATSVETSHDSERETEFLVASHRGGIAMMKVWRGGQISKSDDLLWIGEPSVADAMAKLEAETPARADWPEEIRLTRAAAQFTGDPTRFVGKGVGGFFVTLLASPVGHTYQDMAGATLSNDFPLAGATKHESGGMNVYHYQVLHGFWRGAAVLTVYLPQPKVGFLYRPLSIDRAVDVITDTSPEKLFGLIGKEAMAMGATIRN